jgi:thiamine biosynthesis lipoprotein
MPIEPTTPTRRREFLTGEALRAEVAAVGGAVADEIVGAADAISPPSGGNTVRLSTRAMACDFAVIMNPGPAGQVRMASDALDLVHQLEDQMTVYREHSELSRLNRQAAVAPVEVERRLFELLLEARRICVETGGSFDPTSGSLVALWRRCRKDGRIPTDAAISEALEFTGIQHVKFDEDARTIRFLQKDEGGRMKDELGKHRSVAGSASSFILHPSSFSHVEFNLGGIGKGHALDRAGEFLVNEGLENWLLHGGHSSILARGDHNALGGWPVGIRNPLFPHENLATILLRNRGLSSSGSGVQYFRHGGKRYGHILDPRTGWPVDAMLSVTVLAPTAAEADALSTAFFVGGVEIAQEYCDNHEGVSALLVPPPHRGRTLAPIVCGISDDILFFNTNAITDEGGRTKDE